MYKKTDLWWILLKEIKFCIIKRIYTSDIQSFSNFNLIHFAIDQTLSQWCYLQKCSASCWLTPIQTMWRAGRGGRSDESRFIKVQSHYGNVLTIGTSLWVIAPQLWMRRLCVVTWKTEESASPQSSLSRGETPDPDQLQCLSSSGGGSARPWLTLSGPSGGTRWRLSQGWTHNTQHN